MANIRPDFFNHIIKGRCPCPPSLAPILEEVTGIDKKVWLSGTKKEKQTAWLMFQIESQEMVADIKGDASDI